MDLRDVGALGVRRHLCVGGEGILRASRMTSTPSAIWRRSKAAFAPPSATNSWIARTAFRGWWRAYHLHLAPQRINRMEHSLTFQAIDDGAVDLIDLYSTDAKIEKSKLRVLKDDRGYFPVYQAVWVARQRLYRAASARVGCAVEAAGRDQRAGHDRHERAGRHSACELRQNCRPIPGLGSAALAILEEQYSAAHARAFVAGRRCAAVLGAGRHSAGADRRALSRRGPGHSHRERPDSNRTLARAAVLFDTAVRRRA